MYKSAHCTSRHNIRRHPTFSERYSLILEYLSLAKSAMAFFFTCGTHTFNSLLAGYENVTAQCQNCGNWSGKVYKRWYDDSASPPFHVMLESVKPETDSFIRRQWFTICFVVCFAPFTYAFGEKERKKKCCVV